MTTESYPLVEVRWLDSRGCHDSWVPLEHFADHGVCEARSAGYLVRSTDDYLLIVPHIGTDPDQGCGEMVIPTSAVVSSRYLDAPDEEQEAG